jgi:hypothetical protein
MDREADKRKRNGERCPASLRMAAKYLKRGYKPRDEQSAAEWRRFGS